ncbi:ABC transporter substrate-binding protein [Streptomyces cucumeris]|uniref:ABC transporter substrate-binding protein n=1 Tax=Streptomyces cucumeris TaxID=2962890 RepID=UPI003D74DEB4
MTVRRRPFSRPFKAAVAALCTALGAPLLAGCGTLAEGADSDSITVVTWAPEGTKATNMPGMPAMAKAYARWVNDSGGINGRTLRIVTCNERNDAIQAARCAQRAKEENAVAVVGSYSQHGRSFISPLEVAGIPYIGGYGLTQEEFESPYSYPVNGGQAALLVGNGRQLASVCRRVSLVRPDTIAGDELPELLDTGLRAGERRPAHDVRAPEGAGDYTRQARGALEGVGADVPDTTGQTELDGSCVTAALGNRTGTFFDSFRRVQEDHPKVRIASVLGSVRQSLVDSTGGGDSALEGAYATGWYPAADDRRWARMNEVISKYAFDDNRIDPADPGTQTTWIGYTVLRSVLESLDGGRITARTVRKALDHGHEVGTGGLTPPLRWGYGDTLNVPNYPRIVNADVTYQVVRDGRLVAVRKGFVDVGRTMERYHPTG